MNAQPSSILIVKTSAIGDIIQTFPVLEYLRQKFPSAQINWVVEQESAPLLKAHPQIGNVLEISSKVWRKAPLAPQTRSAWRAFVGQLRQLRYDLLFDLQGNAKSALITCCARSDVKVGFGIKSVREKWNLLATTRWIDVEPDLNVRLKYLGLVQRYFDDSEPFTASGVHLTLTEEERHRLEGSINLTTAPTLMVCFGSRWKNKQLATSTLIALLRQIAIVDNPFFIFIHGNLEERERAHSLLAQCQGRGVVVGDLSLPLWQALMWKVEGVIAVDSAALHLCGTTQTPSFSVFGPSLALAYKPLEERHVSVQGVCPYNKTFSSRCPILRTCATGACMGQLKADTLFSSYKVWSQTRLVSLGKG